MITVSGVNLIMQLYTWWMVIASKMYFVAGCLRIQHIPDSCRKSSELQSFDNWHCTFYWYCYLSIYGKWNMFFCDFCCVIPTRDNKLFASSDLNTEMWPCLSICIPGWWGRYTYTSIFPWHSKPTIWLCRLQFSNRNLFIKRNYSLISYIKLHFDH